MYFGSLFLNGDNHMRQLITLFLSIGVLTCLPSCVKRTISISGTTYADTSAIPHGFSKKNSFAVASASSEDAKLGQGKLQTKEVEKKIAIVLKKRGYQVNQSQNADYAIVFNYGKKSETKVINVAKYIPGQSITSTSTLSGTYGYYGQCNQHAYTSGTYVYMPEEYTFCTKFLRFHVYDLKQYVLSQKYNFFGKAQTPPHIWEGVVWNVNTSEDLRSYLDFLIIRLVSILGKNTPGTLTLEMLTDDPEVTDLRHTYFNPNSSEQNE
jgi:hypothetical protein